jgi:subtilisin family serine protease
VASVERQGSRSRRGAASPRPTRIRRLHPKLRLIANGSTDVNTLRSERASALSVAEPSVLESVPCLRGPMARPVARRRLGKGAKRGKLEQVPPDVRANVFVRLLDPTRPVPPAIAPYARGRQQEVVIATMSLAQLVELEAEREENEGIAGVELAERVTFSPPSNLRPVAASKSSAPRYVPDPERVAIARRGRAAKRSEVLIGIVDVQGFDFSHRDFLKDGATRFHAFWDQGGDLRDPPDGFDYGAEITHKHMQDAIAAAGAPALPAHLLEPQSQMSVSSHGTHVASIAAGNAGVCPDALIAGVLIDLPREGQDRRLLFYDSTRLADAVSYLRRLGDRLGRPVSINISLGTNGHAHDGTSGVSRFIDGILARPGGCVCVAAGNAGQEAPVEPGDAGFMMGRIHTSGRIAASGLTRDIHWIVMGDGMADLSENELEIWYPAQDRFDVMLRPPDSRDWIGPLGSGSFVENRQLADGTFVSIYNERYHPANGSNCISVFLSPFLTRQGVAGVKAGTWTVRLIGRDVRDGRYHGWIERDDPRRLGRAGLTQAWSLPSFFSRRSNVDGNSVSSLACGHHVIGVANLDRQGEVINVTSSQGPTRDGREKPEIAAPGTDVVAASGFDPESEWVSMSGTSMASPFVAGVVGLMLQIEPNLTAAQVGGIIRRTARPLPGADFSWRDDAGYGRVDAEACLQEAAAIYQRKDRT